MKRILAIGGGLIGSRHVAEVLAHPECTLVGLVDPDPQIAADPKIKRFSDISDVTDPVDGAIIATPTHLHAAHATQAAERGWHLLIEKPVASTPAEAQALSTTVATAGVASLVGHHRRYHAPVSQLKALLADGQIGDIVTATMIWAMRKPDPYFEGNWRTAGGSPVMINLVHDIDLLRYVIGEIAEAIALPGRPLRNAGRIESGAVALAFENGAAATISFADTAPSPWGFEAGTGENPNIGTTAQDMLWITGTKGAVSFPSMAYWRGTDWGQPATRHPLNVKANTYTPLRAQLTHFLEVMDGAPPRIDIADAARTLEIATQIESQLSNALRDPTQVELEHAS